MSRNMKNPLFWHRHPNPWIRRTAILSVIPVIVLVIFPTICLLAWVWGCCKNLGSLACEFFDDAWYGLRELADLVLASVWFGPRIWWQPVDQQWGEVDVQ